MPEESQNTKELFLSKTLYFFPVQLLLAHFKRNTLLIFIWLLVFLFITKQIAVSFGVPYLFLYPEYLGKVGFTSHLILGFASGGLIMAFNISGYILNAYNFPFMATLSRPFFKYSLNNFIIPSLFFVVYIYEMYSFQRYEQLEQQKHIFLHIFGFVTGNIIFIILSLSYFFSTSKSVFELLHLTDHTQHKKKSGSLARSFMLRFENINKHMMREGEFRVDRYLNDFNKISLARDSAHYDKRTLSMVFAQNHINASLFEFLVILTVVILGIFRDYDVFQIPAGASVLILLSMTLMIFSAIYSWFKKWSTIIIVLLILFMYHFSSDNIQHLNKASGLKYSGKHASYTAENILMLQRDTNQLIKDRFHHLQILEHWKSKNIASTNIKPKIIFVNCSGGGLRSALWSYYSLAYLDSFLGSAFTQKIHLITGASGGMFGAAYFRELYLRKQSSPFIHLRSKKYLENISKDLLNPIGLSIAVHDLFFNVGSFLSDGGVIKDRAYAFEKQINKNTDSILYSRKLLDYVQPEFESKIPLMIMHPTIINDFRKLIISSQPSSFLTGILNNPKLKNNFSVSNVEFVRLFKDQDPYQLEFLSALRMNGTFPYILPNVCLPSEPMIQVMDAGVRDNLGMEITLQYILNFQDWIKQNTSGVIILQLRDNFKTDAEEKIYPPDYDFNASPLSALLGKITIPHNYIQDNELMLAAQNTTFPIEVISLELFNIRKDKISLNWHLTKKEKLRILKSMNIVDNEKSIYRLTSLLYPIDSSFTKSSKY